MKRRKFTKVISFMLSIALIFSTVAIKASAYSTVTTSYNCPKSLCFSDLVISGPYGDPNETVDSGVPYLGGMTYANVFNNYYWSNSDKYNEYHMYLIYCPKYDNSDTSLLRHTMTLMFARHGYTTVGYTKYNASYHYVNKVCDHGTDFKGSNVYALSQSLCGENAMMDDETLVNLADEYQAQNGCGKEAAELVSHTWGYGDWYDTGNSYHTRTKTCIYCGYSTTETQDHDMIKGEWFNYGSENSYDETYSHIKYHQRDTVCSICGYTESEHAEHEMVIKSDWHSIDDSWHSMTKECSYCLYTAGYESNHHFTDTATHTYEQLDETQHTAYMPCDECGYIKTEMQAHTFLDSVYTQYSEKQHMTLQTCVCVEQQTTYEEHTDSNNDCYCDKCGFLMSRFSVTVPTTLALTIGTDGEVYSSTDVVIVNNSTATVVITQVDVSSQNGWSIVPYSTNMANEKVDSKEIGFEMNGVQTVNNGLSDSFIYGNEWAIEKDSSSTVVYDAVVSATSSPIDEQVLEVVFIVNWKE